MRSSTPESCESKLIDVELCSCQSTFFFLHLMRPFGKAVTQQEDTFDYTRKLASTERRHSGGRLPHFQFYSRTYLQWGKVLRRTPARTKYEDPSHHHNLSKLPSSIKVPFTFHSVQYIVHDGCHPSMQQAKRSLSHSSGRHSRRDDLLVSASLCSIEDLLIPASHIFCLRCADELGLTRAAADERSCPACNQHLPNTDDAVKTVLQPTEDYKTSVLSGLDPTTIMECAGRALAFWSYQTAQEM